MKYYLYLLYSIILIFIVPFVLKYGIVLFKVAILTCAPSTNIMDSIIILGTHGLFFLIYFMLPLLIFIKLIITVHKHLKNKDFSNFEKILFKFRLLVLGLEILSLLLANRAINLIPYILGRII